MSKSKLNLTCLVGTDRGTIKVINAYTLKEESQINLNLGSIGQIKKFNGTYFFSAEDKLYSFNDLSEVDCKEIYEPNSGDGHIVKFDFIDDGFLLGYCDEVHIVKNNEMAFKICGGKYKDICLLRNNHVAVGGDNTELTVYDLSNPDVAVFTGKTRSNKELSLPAKIHLCSLAQDTDNDSILYCGTQFNTVQLYDIRSNQKTAQQVSNFDLNFGVNGLLSLSSQRVLGSSSNGSLGIVDFRYVPKNKLPAKGVLSRVERFKNSASGVITCMTLCSGVNSGDNGKKQIDVLLTTSFDRQLRIYDAKSRLLMDKMHLGASGTCAMFESINRCTDEDMWQDLERLDDEPINGKRQRSNDITDNDTKRKKE